MKNTAGISFRSNIPQARMWYSLTIKLYPSNLALWANTCYQITIDISTPAVLEQSIVPVEAILKQYSPHQGKFACLAPAPAPSGPHPEINNSQSEPTQLLWKVARAMLFLWRALFNVWIICLWQTNFSALTVKQETVHFSSISLYWNFRFLTDLQHLLTTINFNKIALA